MLRGISPFLGPELLYTLCCMGHGNELVLADAHFTAYSLNDRVLRADGVDITSLLHAILPLFPLDVLADDRVVMMKPTPGDTVDASVETRYRAAIDTHYPETPPIYFMERFAFYERTKAAFAVLLTGELAKYGNIIIKKGVVE